MRILVTFLFPFLIEPLPSYQTSDANVHVHVLAKAITFSRTERGPNAETVSSSPLVENVDRLDRYSGDGQPVPRSRFRSATDECLLRTNICLQRDQPATGYWPHLSSLHLTRDGGPMLGPLPRVWAVVCPSSEVALRLGYMPFIWWRLKRSGFCDFVIL